MQKDYKDLKVGKEFDVFQGKRLLLREWTRTIMTLLVVVACLAALAFAAIYGDRVGDDHLLLTVWAVVAVPLSAITGYYFRGSKPSGESDN